MCDHDMSLAQDLIDFMLTFPLPRNFKKILQEQVASATFSVEHYEDCFKILFKSKESVKTFPAWTPTLLQSCQLLKDSGPFVCQLFVEKGYIVQFEVVDMGLIKIDWDYFWLHEPIFDIEYDLGCIKKKLEIEGVSVSRFWACKTAVSFELDANGHHHTVHLNGCNIRTFPTAGTLNNCTLIINSECHDEPPYTVMSVDGRIDITCALIGLQKHL